MFKLVDTHPRVCPTDTSAVGKTITLAILTGIMLGAWPVFAQVDGGDPSVPPWQRPPSRRVVDRPSRPSYRESPNAATKQERSRSTTIIPQASASQRSFANPASRVEKTGFQTTEDGQTQSPAGRLMQPDSSEKMPGVAFCDDGCVGERCIAGCYPDWCGPCRPCYSPLHNRLWVRGEYLLWWTQGSSLPPLVTTSTSGTDPRVAGCLDKRARVSFGNSTVNTDANSGWRVALGYWFDDCQCTD